MKYAKTIDHTYGESVNKWVFEAKVLADEAKTAYETKQIKMDEFYLCDAKSRIRRINVINQMGYIRHSFVLAFYYLIRCSHKSHNENVTFANAMREVASLGGHSDSNACIVGAMLGAIFGFDKLPDDMVKTVLACDVTGEGQKRPEQLSIGKTAIENIVKLIQCRVHDDKYKLVN